jgi:hypothetical protein
MPAFFVAGSAALVLADQLARSEPVWSELWLDMPLAALLAAVAWLWWSSPTGPSTHQRHAGAIATRMTR